MEHPASSSDRGGGDGEEGEDEGRHLKGVRVGSLNERECSDFIKYPVRWYILAIYSLFANMQVISPSSYHHQNDHHDNHDDQNDNDLQACVFGTWGPIAQSAKFAFCWTDADVLHHCHHHHHHN